MAQIKFVDVTKRFKNVIAVRDFNLHIMDKEFVTLVGPSGCGKSTTLNMLAGLEDPTSGEIYIDEVLVNNTPPGHRDIAMVFQSYALYPHMTVKENIAFGLRIRKVPKQEIEKRVTEVARFLGIEGLLDRKPRELSGGQRQRVALGRAIIRRPKAFLLDEPLSNLDAKLRAQMRADLKLLFKELEGTVLYVTHDQLEATTLSDRVVVMRDGVIQQVGTPHEVYNKPKNLFVAGFIGSPAMNFLECDLELPKVITDGVELELPPEQIQRVKEVGLVGKCILGIRPEDIRLNSQDSKIAFEVEVTENVGSGTIVHARRGANRIVLITEKDVTFKRGEVIRLNFGVSEVHIFDVNTGNAAF